MATIRLFLRALILGVVAGYFPGCGSVPPADIVFTGGTVYTADASAPKARAVAVADGRIMYVGDEGGVRRYIAPETREVSLNGGMLLPGFHDSHIHVGVGGLNLDQCDVSEDANEEAVTAHIARCAGERPSSPWVRGRGWASQVFGNAGPTAALLDSVVADRPALFMSADGHSAWVNSRALALTGITEKTPNPPGGRIDRHRTTRKPTGTLRDAAVFLVARQLPQPSPAEWESAVRKALGLANSLGITSVIEAGADETLLAAFAALEKRGELTARVAASVRTNPRGEAAAEVARLDALRQQYRSGRLKVFAAKIAADGVMESRTAALLEPYVGGSDLGPTVTTTEQLHALTTALDKAGFQLHIHAVGDRAVRMALDGIEAARKANGARDARHQIAHLELVDRADVPRFKTLGVIANVQPLWAYREEDIVELTEPVLGPERSGRLYPLGSLARAGAMLAAGSDWSVSSLDPLPAIQVAITRRDPEAPAGTAWLADELVSFDTALQAYTNNGAYAAFQEALTGSIAVGKAADLVVLNRDLSNATSQDIHLTRVVSTFIDGREVYTAPR